MNALNEFEQIVDKIYGFYLDSTSGFGELKMKIGKAQTESLHLFQKSHPELANIEYLDGAAMIYGEGEPGTPEAVELHRCNQKQYKERNSEKGDNFKLAGNLCLVSLYQYWEDHYRSKIAALIGTEKNTLNIDIMGDLRLLRNSIIHHAGIALKDVEQCKLLKWFKEGEEIFIDKEKFKKIIFLLKHLIKKIKAAIRS